MTALTQNRDVPRLDDIEHPLVKAPLKANVHLFQGAMVAIDVNGWAKPAGSAAAATDKIVGVAMLEVDNTGGANGDKWISARPGVFGFFQDGNVVQADLFKKVFVLDDQTVAHADQTAGTAGTCYSPLGEPGPGMTLPVSAGQGTDGLTYVFVGAAPLV